MRLGLFNIRHGSDENRVAPSFSAPRRLTVWPVRLDVGDRLSGVAGPLKLMYCPAKERRSRILLHSNSPPNVPAAFGSQPRFEPDHLAQLIPKRVHSNQCLLSRNKNDNERLKKTITSQIILNYTSLRRRGFSTKIKKNDLYTLSSR